jgi:pimeloyl-ACP methyl ester carboxylesterase
MHTSPFTVNIPQQRLDELKSQLSIARLPPAFYEGTQPKFGVTSEWVRDALKEWKENYDWKSFESKLKSYGHFIAKVPFKNDISRVHYIHYPSKAPNAIPLLLLHGWPGSFIEFLDAVDILKETREFHIVVASLPGFTFSQGPPVNEDFQLKDVANMMNSLMLGLGYSEYAAQGGDLGFHICRALALQYPNTCKGQALFTTMLSVLFLYFFLLTRCNSYTFEHVSH